MDSAKTSKRNTISMILYTITLFMILLRKYMISILKEDIPIDRVTSLLFYGSIALLFLQFIIRKKHNITELIIFVIACGLYIFTKEGSILVLILLAISIRDIDDKYVVKSYMIINLLFIVTCMMLGNLMPYITQVPEVHYRLIEGKYIARETFGFANPNSIFMLLLPVYAAYIYLRFDKYDIFDRIVLIASAFYVYNKTMSRTGFATIIGALLVVEILRLIDLRKSNIVNYIIKSIPIIFLVSSLIIGTVLSNVAIFNKLLASRPKHWNAYLTGEGSILTLFGNKFSEVTKIAHPLDSSYVYIVAFLGLVSLVFFMYLLYKGLDIFIKNNEKKYIAVVLLFLVCSLAENILLEAGYNFTIILLIKQVINNNPKDFTLAEVLRLKKQV